VKGSHIVLPKLYDHDRAYIFQNADGRIIFAIPYERDFTLIGTTDEDHDDPNEAPRISDAEITYLCAAASGYFRTPIRREDIVWTYSGLRPLYDDGAGKAQEATRDYVLKLDAPAGQAPLLSVFGGKITTYRKLAEAALAELRLRPERAGWTARTPLPGGDFAPDGNCQEASAPACCAPMAPALGAFSRPARTPGSPLVRICMRPSLNICAARNGPPRLRMCFGAAASLGSASMRGHRKGWPGVWGADGPKHKLRETVFYL
jgi:glycerol-3-phosphate dehydrogenase